MTLYEGVVVLGSLLGLAVAGWLFLNHSLYRDHEEKDRVVQVSILLIALCITGSSTVCRAVHDVTGLVCK